HEHGQPRRSPGVAHAVRDALRPRGGPNRSPGRAERRHSARKSDARKVIELRDVWLYFDRPVLRGVDLHVCEGETLLVLGESGMGKSTILKLILRLLVPDRGSVRVFGREITRLPFAEVLK